MWVRSISTLGLLSRLLARSVTSRLPSDCATRASTLGLGVPGVVIYFPLSPEFALGLHCLSIAEHFRQEHEKLARLSDEALVSNPGLYACFEQTVCILEGFRKGLPIRLQPENVENLNSLQVIYAERFVFSSDGNFALAEDMMRTNPELRKGPQLAVDRKPLKK